MAGNGNAGHIKSCRNKRISHKNIDNKLGIDFSYSSIKKVEKNPYMVAVNGGKSQKHQQIQFY